MHSVPYLRDCLEPGAWKIMIHTSLQNMTTYYILYFIIILYFHILQWGERDDKSMKKTLKTHSCCSYLHKTVSFYIPSWTQEVSMRFHAFCKKYWLLMVAGRGCHFNWWCIPEGLAGKRRGFRWKKRELAGSGGGKHSQKTVHICVKLSKDMYQV